MSAAGSDEGYDLRAVREVRPDINWSAEFLVQVKAYRHRRVSVAERYRLAICGHWKFGGAAMTLVLTSNTTSWSSRWTPGWAWQPERGGRVWILASAVTWLIVGLRKTEPAE